MSITDDDLDFMASAMWKDALLPDDGELEFSLLPEADGVDIPGEVSGTQASASKPTSKKIEWKRPVKLAVTPASVVKTSLDNTTTNASGTGSKPAKPVKDKAKKQPQLTSPLTDLYLSSPAEALMRPKKDSKLSKSMRGASQNQKKGKPATLVDAAPPKTHNANETVAGPPSSDPYDVPISPESNHQQTSTSAKKVRTVSPVTTIGKQPSLLGLIPSSTKKTLKPQKRVAKRSFLDPSATPEKETKIESLQSKAIPKTPAPTQKKLAKPQKQQEKQKKAPKTSKISKAADTKADPQRQLLVSEAVKEEGLREASADGPVAAPAEDVIKKLRPRREKPAIIISSDSETNYGDDDDCSDSGFAPDAADTTMTSPEDFSTSDVSAKFPPAHDIVTDSFEKPTRASGNYTTSRTDASDAPANSSCRDTSVASPKMNMNERIGEISNTRGRSQFSDKIRLERLHDHRKRHGSPEKAHGSGRSEKRQRHELTRTLTNSRAEMAPQAQSKARMVARNAPCPVPVSDPFLECPGDERLQQTQFTTKLLQSTAPPAIDTNKNEAYRDRSSMAFAATSSHLQARERPTGRVKLADSDGVASQMMQLLVSTTAEKPEHESSTKDIWLSGTDPYKKTGEIMGYVCNTILRFLKSKEAAIEDVANEYHQRGGAVLSRIKELHEKERSTFVKDFEDDRLRSVEIFQAAYRDVQRFADKLESISLVPAINNVLSDNTVSRLRALQVEIA